jgi:hypothetical protein
LSGVDLLRFGAEAEVMEPPELRANMAETAAGMNMIHGRRYSGEITAN